MNPVLQFLTVLDGLATFVKVIAEPTFLVCGIVAFCRFSKAIKSS